MSLDRVLVLLSLVEEDLLEVRECLEEVKLLLERKRGF